MWIRKGKRDHLKGIDSPMPTQLVSNEEFIPRRQSQKQQEMEYWIGQIADEKSKKLGMDRRRFMASSMGLATCFLAANKAWGKVFDVDEAEATEEAAYHEKWPKGDYFVLDVQSHFTNGIPIGLRGEIGKMEFFRNMGFKLGESKDEYSFHNFIKEMFFDSETDMIVISGVPGREEQRDKSGKVNVRIQSSELARLVAELTNHLGELNLDAPEMQKAEAQIATLKAQLIDEPNPIIVQQAGRTLRNIIEGAIGSLFATAAQPAVWQWIRHALASFS